MGDDVEDPIVIVFGDFVQLIVDGNVPGYLRQWYGGGRLVGIGKDSVWGGLAGWGLRVRG